MRYSNIDGVTGFTFIIGYGANGAPIRSNNGVLLVGRIQSTVDATTDQDLTNLKTVNAQVEAASTEMKAYVDQKVQESGESGESGTTITMLPLITLTPEELVSGYTVNIGALAANKFIDKVVFELKETISSDIDQDLLISIGTGLDHTAFGSARISQLNQTQVVNICKTLDEATDLFLYVSIYEEPPDIPSFTQVVFNDHADVEDTLSSDASYLVWTATFVGTNLLGEISQKDTFGDRAVGNMMDFGINIPVQAGHTYRVVQQNPALQIYDGYDEFVSQVEGVWTKSKTYTIDTGSDETQLDYYFLLTESNGDNDYVHIYIYDEEDPSTAIRTYHIHNQLKFEGTSPIASLLQLDYASASEAAVGIVQNADNQYTLTLNGEVTNLGEQVSSEFAGVTGNATKLGIYYPKHISASGIRAIIYNPAAQLFTGDESTLQSSGVFYTDVTMTDEDEHDGCWIYFPIVENKQYPIVIAIIDLETHDYMLFGIDNNLTFKQAQTESTENISEVNAFAAPMSNEVMPLVDENSTGKVLVRVISF